jgi:hypothetical protein
VLVKLSSTLGYGFKNFASTRLANPLNLKKHTSLFRAFLRWYIIGNVQVHKGFYFFNCIKAIQKEEGWLRIQKTINGGDSNFKNLWQAF